LLLHQGGQGGQGIGRGEDRETAVLLLLVVLTQVLRQRADEARHAHELALGEDFLAPRLALLLAEAEHLVHRGVVLFGGLVQLDEHLAEGATRHRALDVLVTEQG
jgi:hypothetical protein